MKLFWPTMGTFEQAFENLAKEIPFEPFDAQVLAFAHSLSKKLLTIRHLPEVVALGFWLRKAHIQEMKEAWKAETNGKVKKARGTVFHIAPSNVDTIFIYSWILSLLAGNRNIIRISSKDQSNELLDAIIEVLSRPEFESIGNRTIICTYSHDENYTEIISNSCQTRVIWGGDETIRRIRQVPLAPMANELAFPDRFSLAAFNSDVVVQLDNQELSQLLEKFYNDVFWFNQMACSSPRLIIWTGENKEKAKNRFWSAFEKTIQSKQFELMAASQVSKLTTSLWMASEAEVESVQHRTYFSRVQMVDFPEAVRERHCGAGLFFEYDADSLRDLVSIIIDKDQTLSYFGYEKEDLLSLVQAVSSRGIDQIVPIGQALDFHQVWDGQNFLTSFTREVVIN